MRIHKQVLTPARPTHPGKLLAAEIEERGWTRAEFAQRVGCSDVFVYKFVAGKRGISAEMSIKFGRVLGVDEALFFTMWKRYQLFEAVKKMGDEVIA